MGNAYMTRRPGGSSSVIKAQGTLTIKRADANAQLITGYVSSITIPELAGRKTFIIYTNEQYAKNSLSWLYSYNNNYTGIKSEYILNIIFIDGVGQYSAIKYESGNGSFNEYATCVNDGKMTFDSETGKITFDKLYFNPPANSGDIYFRYLIFE